MCESARILLIKLHSISETPKTQKVSKLDAVVYLGVLAVNMLQRPNFGFAIGLVISPLEIISL